MQSDPSLIIIPLIVGIILLIIEYRTRWFAQHINPKSNGQFSGSVRRDESKAGDWVEAISNVRATIAKIYGIKTSEVRVVRWEFDHRKTELHVKVSFLKPIGGGAFSPTYDTIIADTKGRILRHQEEYS